jgi:serine/threonine protein kinase
MNYCPAGTIRDAIPAVEGVHNVKIKGALEKIGPPEIINDGYDIPEPLLWKWFEDLAKACRLMDEEQDFSNDPKDPRPGLNTIVHRDIKPSNVFLDLPSNVVGDWPSYPVAIMGDFGE